MSSRQTNTGANFIQSLKQKQRLTSNDNLVMHSVVALGLILDWV